MFIPRVGHILGSSNGLPITSSLQLDKSPRFSLDMSGVAGLVGGDDAASAMFAVHVYGNHHWLGWYNNIGSLQIAKRLRSFAKSFSSTHDFKSVQTDPTTLLDLHACKGPKFRAAHSGTVIEETGYLAALFMKECTAWDSEGKVVPGRRTQPVGISIVDLGHAPPSELHPAPCSAFTLLFASAPIATSISTCALSALCGDWYASSLILLGIVASGVSCLVLGSADFVFAHPEPAKGSPAGDGILTSGKDIVLLRGTEGAVNSVTRGTFSIRFSSKTHLDLIRWSSVLLFIQCVAQLLLIPQASLSGQVMFLVSLAVSALYTARLSSSDKEKIDRKMLFERVLENPTLTKYTLGTRTTAVVFMLLVLHIQDPAKLLDELLPNDTKVWKRWKATVLERLRQHPRDQSRFRSRSLLSVSESKELWDVEGFTREEQDLLGLLFEDARSGYGAYMDYVGVDSL